MQLVYGCVKSMKLELSKQMMLLTWRKYYIRKDLKHPEGICIDFVYWGYD